MCFTIKQNILGFTVYIREGNVFSPLTHVVQPNVCEVYGKNPSHFNPFSFHLAIISQQVAEAEFFFINFNLTKPLTLPSSK